MTANELAMDVAGAIRGYVMRSHEALAKKIETVSARPADIREMTGDERKAIAESLQPYIEAAHAKWALEFERSATELMLKTIAAIPEPAPGKDGADGLGFDDLKIEYDGERRATLIYERGEVRKEFNLIIPAIIDRGIYQTGKSYEKGDGASFGGSFWIAQKDTNQKPGSGDDWRLAVKKGRDAKERV